MLPAGRLAFCLLSCLVNGLLVQAHLTPLLSAHSTVIAQPAQVEGKTHFPASSSRMRLASPSRHAGHRERLPALSFARAVVAAPSWPPAPRRPALRLSWLPAPRPTSPSPLAPPSPPSLLSPSQPPLALPPSLVVSPPSPVSTALYAPPSPSSCPPPPLPPIHDFRACFSYVVNLLWSYTFVVFSLEVVLLVGSVKMRVCAQNSFSCSASALTASAAVLALLAAAVVESAVCYVAVEPGPAMALSVPLAVITMVPAALAPNYRTYYVDSGACDENFYERWSELCVERQQQRQRISAARHKYRNAVRRWRRKMSRKHAQWQQEIGCSLAFRQRTAGARLSRWLSGVLRNAKRRQIGALCFLRRADSATASEQRTYTPWVNLKGVHALRGLRAELDRVWLMTLTPGERAAVAMQRARRATMFRRRMQCRAWLRRQWTDSTETAVAAGSPPSAATRPSATPEEHLAAACIQRFYCRSTRISLGDRKSVV